LPEHLERFIKEYDVAEQPANNQLAAIAKGRTPRLDFATALEDNTMVG
jgi:hypothetical protein